MSSSYYANIPAREYEITWRSGHVETVKAHQVLVPTGGSLFGSVPERRRYIFHAEINGTWTLVLDADADDVRTVREKSSENVAPVSEEP